MGRWKALALAAATGAAMVTGGCRTFLSSAEQGDSASARRVLVAGERTSFKSAVIQGTIDKLGTSSYFFKTIGLDRLAAQDTAGYQAILLVTSMQAGRLARAVSSFVAKDPDDRRVIVFYTRGTEDPLPERSKPDLRVDVVTSASRDDRIETRAGELAALIAARF